MGIKVCCEGCRRFFFKLFCLPNHSRLASLQLYEGLVVPVLRRQVLFSSTPIRLQPLSFFFFSDFVLLLTLFISFFPASSSCVLCSTHSSHFISSHIYAAASCVLFIYGLERGHLLLTKRFFFGAFLPALIVSRARRRTQKEGKSSWSRNRCFDTLFAFFIFIFLRAFAFCSLLFYVARQPERLYLRQFSLLATRKASAPPFSPFFMTGLEKKKLSDCTAFVFFFSSSFCLSTLFVCFLWSTLHCGWKRIDQGPRFYHT